MPVRIRTWLPAFIVLAAIWGSSFLFIKVAVRDLHPLQLTLGRMAVGAAVLLVTLAMSRGQRLPRDPRLWGHFAVVSVFMTTVPFTLFGYGEQHVSSVLAGIWNATMPLWTLLFTLIALRSERPTRSRTLGLMVGFLGVLVVLGVWRPIGGGALAGSLACAGAAACYGVGAVYMRRFVSGRSESTVVLATGQLLVGTLQIIVLTPLFGVSLVPPAAPVEVWASVLALGGLGTGIAYLLMYRVIRLAGLTTASTVTYAIPVFSTVIGVVVLSETLTWNQPLGALVVLVGIAISQDLPKRARSRNLLEVSPAIPDTSPHELSGQGSRDGGRPVADALG